MSNRPIVLKKVRVHNLRGVNLTLQPNQLVVFTGVSGSGKSSLAFDTLFAEGQRRYVESLSTFARRYLGDLTKPDVEHVSGLSPTISIEQKTAGRNPRSTVGTMTEIYDYMRVLWARVATPHCPVSGEVVAPQSRERIIQTVQGYPDGSKLVILAPFATQKKGKFKEEFEELLRKGFMRVRIDGQMVDLSETVELDGSVAHNVDVVIDRLVQKKENKSRIADGLSRALDFGEGLCTVVVDDDDRFFSQHAYSQKSGLSYPALQPHFFSFNSPTGMCPTCHGLGVIEEFDLDLVIDPDKSVSEDCCSIASSYSTVRFGNIYDNILKKHVDTPWKKLPESAKEIFLYGTKKKWTRMRFVHPDKGTAWNDYVQWKGVLHEAHAKLAEAKSDLYQRKMRALMTSQACHDCHGMRLAPYPAAAKLGEHTISQITDMPVSDAHQFFSTLQLNATEQMIGEELLKEIKERLAFLIDVGLAYLSLSRQAPTLSGGEAQRVRLASQVGCGLVGVTYVLDEPSIGLHPRDNRKLLDTLKSLRDRGNTVVVVEHDEETIRSADHIVDFGPKAGSEGGEIIVDGSVDDLLKSKRSLTGDYLAQRRVIPTPKKRRQPTDKQLTVVGAAHHNLKEIDVAFPLGLFIAVTGVSGSGKSSLVSDILQPALTNLYHHGSQRVGKHKGLEGCEHLDKVIGIDQSPIGRNPRSNPSTYIKAFDEIRDLFSQLPMSQSRGYLPGRFSFNVAEGSCSNCRGMGHIKIDMDFMEAAWIICPNCRGRRFDNETLSVFYKGKNIADILDMRIEEALTFFQPIPTIAKKLGTLVDVGLGYLQLGQPSPTLSGGEAQRVKLAKELSRPATGNTLYILDEPTTGLHFYDVDHLLHVLHSLVDRGNTVIVIEHNMEVVKTADWIIDLGPDGGAKGGYLLGSGSPEAFKKKTGATSDALQFKMPEVAPSRKREKPLEEIVIKGAEQNNLKSIDLTIPRGKITVCTGPSGSGKSSLAFDTVYAEGQRRYSESLSPYARQFVDQCPKPKVEQIDGLSPAIAIEQKVHAGNPRSTVGTLTEVYDYLRLLYTHKGIPHCPDTGDVIKAVSKDTVVERILAYPEGEKILILAPLTANLKMDELKDRLKKAGFLRLLLNGTVYELDDEIPFDRRRKNKVAIVVDRFKVRPTMRSRLDEAVETAAKYGENTVMVLRENEEVLFNLSFSVEKTGKSYPPITPHSFSYNSPEGMCPDCTGLGFEYGVDPVAIEPMRDKCAYDLLRNIWGDNASNHTLAHMVLLLERLGIDVWTPLRKLPDSDLRHLFFGSDKEVEVIRGLKLRWRGINPTIAKLGKGGRKEVKEALLGFLKEAPCLSCEGHRINVLARHVTIEGVSLGELCHKPIRDVLQFITALQLDSEDEKVLGEVTRQLVSRLEFLDEVGLHYLFLHRSAPSLSNGEAQRIRLAKQLGSSLTGVLYVLDEPTVGLHPADNERLNGALIKLKELGNTLLLVEHDPMTVSLADKVIDFGPGAGTQGGHIVASGTLSQIKRNSKSLTGAYLSGKKTIPLPETLRTSKKELTIINASMHNLKDISVSFPVGAFSCVTGVSGAGKSSLVTNLLAPAVAQGIKRSDSMEQDGATIVGIDAIKRLIVLDQNPIGTTARSDVGTYVDLMPHIRQLYAKLPRALSLGLTTGHFSTNAKKGMCTACQGMGYKKIEMQFLPAVRVTCDECKGYRLNPLSLDVKYMGTHLGKVLDMTVDEARLLFANFAPITKVLDTLISVGLGYLKLGQEVATLSGGEAQRVKISRELAKKSRSHTLYLLDEPTTGLHFEDIKTLVDVLHRLVDQNNTVIAIEHNLDFIKQCDYAVDLGPGGGAEGGYLLAACPPSELPTHPNSLTGRYLAS